MIMDYQSQAGAQASTRLYGACLSGPRQALCAVLFTIVGFFPALGVAANGVGADVLPAPTSAVLLTVSGAITHTNHGGEARFDREMINRFAQHTIYTSTAVTDGANRFDGILMRDVLNRVGARGKTITALALNDYSVDIPVTDFERFDVLLATHMDGELLKPTDKGPFWIVYPRDQSRNLQDIRYDYRWVWQLHRITVQ